MIISNVLTMVAGEVREMACGGNYFELRTAAGLVSLIELLDRSGGVVSLLTDAEATDYVRTSRNFEQVRITNGATAQAVKFYYGDGDSGSNRFTGAVTGTLALDAATIAALIAGKYIVRPELSTGNFNNSAALAANTPLTVFTPAANLNGAIILSAEISDFDATFSSGGFIAKSSAPTSVNDGELILMSRTIGAYSTTNLISGGSLPKEQSIAAGLGLYFIRGSALSVSMPNSRSCRYKLL